MRILLLLSLFLATANAHATFDCVDYFAIQHRKFPVKTARYAGTKFPCISFLWSTFGTRKAALKAFLKGNRNRPHVVKVHATNEVCRRFGVCVPKADFLARMSVNTYNKKLASGNKKVKKKLRKLYREIKKTVEGLGNKNTRIVLSLGLESQYTKKAMQNLTAIAKEQYAEFNIVHNPVKNAPYHGRGGYPAIMLEFHGLQPNASETRYTTSDDGFRPDYCGDEVGGINGVQLSDASVRFRYTKHSGRAFAIGCWCAAWQGLQSGDSSHIKPPRQRDIRASRRVLDRYIAVSGM